MCTAPKFTTMEKVNSLLHFWLRAFIKRYTTSIQDQFITFTKVFEYLGCSDIIWNSRKQRFEPSPNCKFMVFCLYTGFPTTILACMLINILFTYKSKSIFGVILFGLTMAILLGSTIVNSILIFRRKELASFFNWILPHHYKLDAGKRVTLASIIPPSRRSY